MRHLKIKADELKAKMHRPNKNTSLTSVKRLNYQTQVSEQRKAVGFKFQYCGSLPSTTGRATAVAKFRML